jgi:hypothetical protein
MNVVPPKTRVLALSLAALAVFLAWEALALRSYLRVDSRPPSWDQAIHLEIALDYRNAIQAGDWSAVMHLAPKAGMPPFPPLYHLLLKTAYLSSDPAHAAIWLNWFYLAILCVALFSLAWRFRADETALLCVLIFAGSPTVQELLHTQLVDLALVAWAAAAYWALLRSEDFQRWGWSLAFGVLFALGMLHKWSFFSYFLPAYYLGLKALARPASRRQVLAAAGVSLAAFMPWYWMHLSVVIPRLFQASADFAVPFWRGTAVLNYLGQMTDGLGPLFCVLSLVGICMLQRRRHWHGGWVLVAWFISSYIFWTIVPNRQLRYLLPGLPALAVAGLGAWPRIVVWGLAAVQSFTLLNFTSGWVRPIPIPVPLRSVTLFPSQPPAPEDWKIEAILSEAEKRADPDQPIADLTLVANDAFFNCSNFDWLAKLRELPHVRIRGVNNRLCEFAQFVVLKDGYLGPPSVIGPLPKASETIKDPQGWFTRSYEQVRRWPLPDGSAAVLFQQKHPTRPPFPGRKLEARHYSAGGFEATDLVVELGSWDAPRGVYRRAKATAREARLRGLRLDDLQVEMDGLFFVPVSTGDLRTLTDIRFLKMDTLRIEKFRVQGDALRAFLENRAPGLRISDMRLDQTLKLRGDFRGFPVSVEIAAEVQGSSALHIGLRDARLGTVPVPGFLLRPLRSFTQPFVPTRDMPFFITVSGLTVANGRLSVP